MNAFYYRAATEYKKSFIQSEIGVKHKFANKVFCGWDYNIATKGAAALKSAAIYHDLRVNNTNKTFLLIYFHLRQELINQSLADKQKLTRKQTFINYLKYVFVNILVVSLISLVGFLVWLMEQWKHENAAVVTAIFINILITGFPILFSFIIK